MCIVQYVRAGFEHIGLTHQVRVRLRVRVRVSYPYP